jgi:hypothetical protein
MGWGGWQAPLEVRSGLQQFQPLATQTRLGRPAAVLAIRLGD